MKFTIAFFVIAIVANVNCGGIGDHGSYSGPGLSSIAQGSANDAHQAVANQHVAAKKASFIAKATLAQQASQAAATAQTALAGKHVLLQTLQKFRDEAHKALEGELAQQQSAHRSAASATATAQQANKQVAAMQGALHSSQELAHQAEAASANASQQLASQSKMVAEAKARLDALNHQVKAVQEDYLATKAAAERAAEFAQKAKSNAAAVNDGGHAGGGAGGHGGAGFGSGGHGGAYGSGGHGYIR